MAGETYSMDGSDKGKKTSSRCNLIVKLVLATLFLIIIIVLAVVFVTMDDDDDEETVTTVDPLDVLLGTLNEELDGKPNITLSNFTNWDEREERNNVFVAKPSNVEEVQNVVKAAAGLGLRLRPVGSAYSYSNLFPDEGDVLLETSGLSQLLGSDQAMVLFEAENLVRIAAGVTNSQLKDFLVSHNKMIRATVTVKGALVAGIVGTNSHGSSLHQGTISDLLWGVGIVKSDGEVYNYKRIDTPEELALIKSCLGMCGVIFELILRVEPLQMAWLDHLLVRSRDLFENTSGLDMLHKTDALMFWAPLSSVNASGWEHYKTTGLIPQDYNAMDDYVWVKAINVTASAPLPRVRRDVMSYSAPPLITGSHYNPESNRVRRDDQTEHTALNAIHKVAWDYTYDSFANFTPEQVPTPEAVVTYRAEDLSITYSTAFNFPESADFATTRAVMKLVLSTLEEEAHAGRMPVLTVELAWIAASKACDLCFNNHNSEYALTVDFVGADYKEPVYSEFIEKMFTTLKEQFPGVKVEWAKMSSSTAERKHVQDSYPDGIKSLMSYDQHSESFFSNAELRKLFY